MWMLVILLQRDRRTTKAVTPEPPVKYYHDALPLSWAKSLRKDDRLLLLLLLLLLMGKVTLKLVLLLLLLFDGIYQLSTQSLLDLHVIAVWRPPSYTPT